MKWMPLGRLVNATPTLRGIVRRSRLGAPSAWLALLLLAALVGVGAGLTPSAPTAGGGADGLEAARQRAVAAGSYRFNATIQQAVAPRGLTAAGAPAQGVTLHADGEVRLPDQARVTLTAAGASIAAPITLLQIGGRTFLQKGEVLEPTEDTAAMPTGSADMLGLLDAAANVRLLDGASADHPARYAFELDGPRLSEYLRSQAEERLRRAGVSNARVDLARAQGIAGGGELWVDAQGMPRRAVLDLTALDPRSRLLTTSRMQVDFSDYGRVPPLPRPESDADGRWRLAGPGPSAPALDVAVSTAEMPGAALVRGAWSALAPGRALGEAAAPALVASAILGLVVGAIRHRRRRSVYGALVALTIASLIGSPLLQATQVARVVAPHAEAAALLPLAKALAQSSAAAQGAPTLTPAGGSAEAGLLACGEGDHSADFDRDGLTDADEACLGTASLNPDTDGDGLPDGLEARGIDVPKAGGGTFHLISDPLRPDSSGDGESDLLKWPADTLYMGETYGAATSWDFEGNGIPNVWNPDIDGDGVPNATDLSPYAKTAIVDHFGLNVRGGGFDVTGYIEVQVQPENRDHLLYDSAKLSWPLDSRGQIQRLASADDSVRLVPVLQIDADVAPSKELAERYQLDVRQNGSTFRITAPLSASGDGSTYYAKAAYGPVDGRLPGVTWDARLVWLAVVKNQTFVSGTGTVTNNEVVQVYPDRARVTGLQVSKSRSFEAAVFATPSTPTEDRDLFLLMFGLSSVFLDQARLEGQSTDSTALGELVRRFGDPLATSDQRLGVDPVVPIATGRQLYGHRDEGIAGLSDLTTALLDARYPDGAYAAGGHCQDPAGNQFRCANVATAWEEQGAVVDLEDMPARVEDGTVSVYADLLPIPLSVSRGVRLNGFEYQGGRWTTMPLERLLEVANKRYSQALLAELLEALRPDLPSIEAEDLKLVNAAAYAALYTGRTSLIRTDEHFLVPVVEPELEKIQRYVAVTARIPTRVRNRALAVFGIVSSLLKEVDVSRESVRRTLGPRASETSPKLVDSMVRQHVLRRLRSVGFKSAALFSTKAVYEAGMIAISAWQTSCAVKPELSGCELFGGKNGEPSVAGRAIVIGLTVLGSTNNVSLIYKSVKLLKANPKLAKLALASEIKVAGKLGKASIIGAVFAVGIAWLQFGLATQGVSPGSGAFNILFVTALFETLWVAILLVLSTIPFVNIVVAIFEIVDAIVYAVTGFSISGQVVQGLVSLFVGAEEVVDVKSASFVAASSVKDPLHVNPNLKPGQTAAGLVAGDRLLLTDHFRSVADADGSKGFSRDVVLSRLTMTGSYVLTAPEGGATIVDLNARARCGDRAEGHVCENDAGAAVHLSEARQDLHLQLKAKVDYRVPYVYIERVFGAEINRYLDRTDGSETTDPTDVYIDVLPATVDGLWAWPVLGNPLRDVHYADRNGLTRDQDGDLLPDAVERTLPTALDNPDTDGDGLYDGPEVCHWDGAAGQVAGGWDVRLPSGLTPRICLSAVAAPSGESGLTDSQARLLGVSPYAVFSGPWVDVALAPLDGDGAGKAGTYVTPASAVTTTVTVGNGGLDPIDAVALCLPTVLVDPAQPTWSGDRTPQALIQGLRGCATDPALGGPFNIYTWEFPAGQELRTAESATLRLTAFVGPAAPSGGSFGLLASVGGANKHANGDAHFTVDVDLPSAAISTPLDGKIVSRAIAPTLAVSGIASDPTSWVDEVTLDDGVGGPRATTTGAGTWSTVWTIPSDGRFQLRARARDGVGNVASSAPVMVTVDSTPPTATIDLPNGGYVRPGADGGTIRLEGGAGDPGGTSSGVALVQLSIDGQTWRGVDFANGSWSFDWRPAPDRAQGSHALAVRAIDAAGNIGAPQSVVVVYDAAPPTDGLSTGVLTGAPVFQLGQPITLTGRADDAGRVPAPAHPAALTGPLAIDPVARATTWLEPGAVADYRRGVSLAWLGDVDGDGRADLGVGLPGAKADAGRVAIVYGRGGGWPVPPTGAEALAESPSQLVGAPGAQLGRAIAAAGDANGDGRADLLIGDPTNGRAFLVFGRAGDFGREVLLDGSPRLTQVVLQAAGLRMVAPAGDVNGDGFADLLVGAGGTLYLVLGRASGWPSPFVVPDEAAATVLFPDGDSATGVGDADGDGYADVAVTDRLGRIEPAFGPAVYLFRGRATFAPRAKVRLDAHSGALPFAPGGTLDGRLAAVGDVTGLSAPDFIFGTSNGPRLMAMAGRDGFGNPLWAGRVFGSFASAATGFLVGPGDVDGDGRSDLLLGNANGDAYLVMGAASIDPSAVRATLTGVAVAASAPYAAGADCNCDQSSDLALVPANVLAPRAELAPVSALSPAAVDALPVAPPRPPTVPAAPPPFSGGAAAAAGPAAATLLVDDDYCAACLNDGHTLGVDAFASIQAAVDRVASPGTEIVVAPGIYAPFAVRGAARAGTTVRGTNPDAVFVDANTPSGWGPSAVQVVGTTGVTISNLTLRNADRAVVLAAAGLDAEHDASKTIVLDRLLIAGFNTALAMDRVSNASLRRSTLVGDRASPYVALDSVPATELRPAWSRAASLASDLLPANEPSRVYGASVGAARGKLYALFNPISLGTTFQEYDPALGSWTRRTPPDPYLFSQRHALECGQGSASHAHCGVTLIDGQDGGLYLLSGPTLWRYDLATDNWTVVSIPNGDCSRSPQVLVDGGDGTSLAMIGRNAAGSTQLCRFDLAGHWASPVALPSELGTLLDMAAVWVGDQIYVVGERPAKVGNLFLLDQAFLYRLSIGGGPPTLESIDSTPVEPRSHYESLPSLAWGGDGHLYLATGGFAGDRNFYRFAVGNGQWQALAATAFRQNDHNWLVRVGSSLYSVTGGGDISRGAPLYLNRRPLGGEPAEWAALAAPGGPLDVPTLPNSPPLAGEALAAANGKLYLLAVYNDAPYTCCQDSWTASFRAFNPASGGWTTLAAPATTLFPTVCPFRTCELDQLVDGNDGGLYLPVRNALWRYDLAADAWSTIALPPACSGLMTSVVGGDQPGFSGIGRPDGITRLCTYTGNQWAARHLTPLSVGSGAAATWVNGQIYVSTAGGGGLARVTLGASTATVETLPNDPFRTFVNSFGGIALVWDGADHLLLVPGSWCCTDFASFPPSSARFDLTSGTWETATPTGFDFTNARRMVRDGGAIWALGRTGYMPVARANGGFDYQAQLVLFRRSLSPPTRLTLTQNALVETGAGATATWLSPAGNLPDVGLAGSDNRWVGDATWTPTAPLAPVTTSLAAAGFVDPGQGNYRVELGSSLILEPTKAAGYAVPRPDVYVSPTYCPTCENDGHAWDADAFASVQNAIDAGASRVYLAPGVYREPFHLATGVQIFGAGADLTTVQAPPGVTTGALVTAQGVTGAGLARLTLAGAGQTTGLRALGGAQLKLARAVVRGNAIGLRQEGATTRVEVVNDTFAGNVVGLLSTGCAPVDVRNSAFAFNSGAALRYAAADCPAALNRFNAFYANGTDVDDGTANPQPGISSIAADPELANPGRNDYRPRPGSPLIDAGDPSDRTPPAAGRIDVGYVETGVAAFQVSGSYCRACVNDGLTWNVDAFDRVPPALEAAARDAATAGCVDARCTARFTVGVSPGVYAGRITLPSFVSLSGAGAEQTVLDGGGVGDVVTVDGATQAELRGFWIVGAGPNPEDSAVRLRNGANNVLITRNIISGNVNGVSVSDRSAARVTFNTIFNQRRYGVVSQDAASRAEVANNIVNTTATDRDDGGALGALAGGTIDHHSNLLFNNRADYVDETGAGLVTSRPERPDLRGVDPLLARGDLHLQAGSPAIDAADRTEAAPVGGGERADLGYREVTAPPIVMLFGKEGTPCDVGNSGAASVEIGLSTLPIARASTRVEQTPPTTWSPVTLAGVCDPSGGPCATTARWSTTITPTQEGLYRVYTRATDRLGNREANPADWFAGAFVAVDPANVPAVAFDLATTSTDAAAIALEAQVSSSIDLGRGPEFAVDVVSFEVDGVSWPGEWIDDDWSPTSGRPRGFRAVVPLSVPADGHHTIRAVAVDRAGRRGQSPARDLAMVGGATSATIIPPPGGYVGQRTVTVSGYARFAGLSSPHEVSLQLDGGAPIAATLANRAALLTAWSAVVTLPPEGTSFTLVAAVPGGTGSTATLQVDETVPSVELTSPTQPGRPAGLPRVSLGTAVYPIVTGPATLRGTAGDAQSGVRAVEVSLDGSLTWSPATYQSGQWQFAWTPPANQDGVPYQVAFRARDRAGNRRAHSATLVVDNVAPPVVTLALASPDFPAGLPEGAHLSRPQDLTISWPAPTDGTGVTARLVVDQLADTVPTETVAGTSLVASLGAGTWYVHFLLEDGAGNRQLQHVGPLYVNNLAASCADRSVSVLPDGRLDVGAGEWRAASALLDYDNRAGALHGLYATWGARALYLGWQGDAWAADGAMWAYVDTGAGGTTAPVDPAHAGRLAGGALPFAARYAIKVDGPSSGTLWESTGGAWQPAEPLRFASVGMGTEVELPWSLGGVGRLRLLAYAVDDGGHPTAVFPTTNPLAGPWTTGFDWSSPCAVAAAADGQPQSRNVALAVTSPRDPSNPAGRGHEVTFAFRLENKDPRALAGLELRLAAGPGVSFPGGATVAVAPLASGATTQVTVSARVDDAATGSSSEVTGVLAMPSIGASALARAALVQALDTAPPTLDALPGQKLGLAGQTLVGWASDGDGAGVAKVQVSLDDGGWTDAAGTTAWRASLVIPADGAHSVLLRATDLFGQTSPTRRFDFVVDSAGPAIAFAAPPLVGATGLDIVGTATDPSLVDRVELQVDDEGWASALGPFAPDETGAQAWRFFWLAPASANGVTHHVKARAIDRAGNLTETAAQTFVVHATAVDATLQVTAAPATATPGREVVYRLVLGNSGPNPLAGGKLVATSTPSAALTWTCAASPGASCGTPNGALASGIVLPVGGQVVYDVQAAPGPAARGSLDASFQVVLPDGVSDVDDGDNGATTTAPLAPEADLALALAPTQATRAGDQLTYLVTQSNAGPSTATGLVLQAALADGLSFVSGPGCTAVGRAVECRLDGLDTLQSATASITVQLDRLLHAPVTTTFALAGQEADPVPGDTVASATTTVIPLDLTAPVTAAVVAGTVGDDGWFKGADPVMLALSATDDTLGVAATYLGLDGAAPTAYTGPVVIAAGVHQASYYSVDLADNRETTRQLTIKVDPRPPTIQGARAPAANGFAWNNVDVHVTFQCADDLSGVATCPGESVVGIDGANLSVVGTAFDRAGNSASAPVEGINVDKTAPLLAGAPTTSPNANGWYSANVTIHWTASDALSGLDPAHLPLDVVLTGEGAALVASATTADRAGNTTSAAVNGIKIDRTAPTTGATVGGPPNAQGWYRGAVAITLAGSDALSGVARTEYAVDDGGWTAYAGPIALASPGVHTLLYRSVDRADNVEAAKTLVVKLDTTPPALTCAATPNSLWPPNHQMVAVTVSVSVTDALAGPNGFVLTAATSNEPDDGAGDGNTMNDVQGFSLGTPDTAGSLRAERAGGGAGRVYTLTYTGSDSAGNTATCSATVLVRRD